MKIFKALLLFIVLSFLTVPFVFAKNDDDKGPLTKITFIHYKKDRNQAKPGGSTNNNASPCYGYLAKGAKWKIAENYIVNPTGSFLNQTDVFNAVNAGVNQWETYGGSSIFGNGSLDSSAIIDDVLTDGKNVAAFGAYPDNRVIAVTNVWGYFGGSPQTRELVEWDMLFNTYYPWGDASTNPSLMDVQNIATHELGHSAGMNDLYTASCNLETMYGYSGQGETIKRDLNTGDIKGIQGLY